MLAGRSIVFQGGVQKYLNISRLYAVSKKMVEPADIECVQANLKHLLDQVAVAAETTPQKPRLVAVSKTKHSDLVRACYAIGQRHFGENYIQELEQKGDELKEGCPDIKWHYIGQVQGNKINKLCSVPNLHCVETVESEKHCMMFEKEMAKRNDILNIYIQVNTSGESQKGGASISEVVQLGRFVRADCPHLKLAGFMTIGSVEGSQSIPNPDFDRLFSVRKQFAATMGEEEADFELSMGMSDDFETAIAQGSTSVRVGSKIFGPRLYLTKSNK